MAIVKRTAGCKVGWVWYDNLAEAEAALPRIMRDAQRALELGFDFGFQCPGEIRQVDLNGQPAWMVTTS